MDQESSRLFQAIVGSITDSLAVIDQTGDIRFVNNSWLEFGRCNGAYEEHNNYFTVCANSAANRDESSQEALAGLRALIEGKTDAFSMEYPCHSPTEQRWFILEARKLNWTSEPLFLITHKDITRRILAEHATQELSLTDPLTGLANRRHFDSFLRKEWAARSRLGEQMSLAMFDVDNFKQYNDKFGHPEGDRCLRLIATVLQKFGNRPRDLAARYGGEEFALVLGDSDELSAFRITDKIRKEISELKIPSAPPNRMITISGGVATSRASSNHSVENLLSCADKALYMAKSQGRDRVVRSMEMLERLSA